MPGIEALLAGRTLADRYRIEEVIGRGGMGAVYRATDERLGRPVAVKVITVSAPDAEARERIRARFRHEAASAARLPHHPNVVPVYDYGTDAALGLDFIVMELLRGEDLASRLQHAGPPPLGVALRILQQAARGVNVGHRMGLVHRDVKPGNIFLPEGDDGADPQVRILDFGIAKAIAEEDTASALTHDGRAPLSPAFASPEQLRGDARLSPASDVFSLGAVGWQLLTGEKPFTEADRNRISIGTDVPLPSLRARNAAVPPEVEEVLRRALAFDPAQRYANGGALADALDPLLRRLDASTAAAVPRLDHPVVPDDADDDDRTALAGADDRTMLAPPPGARPGAGAAAAGVVGAGAAAGARSTPAPVMPPPRRRAVQPEKKGPPAILWVVLLLVAGGAGFVAWQAANGGGGGGTDPLAGLPDSAAVDTTVQVDSLTPVDARVLDAEGRRMLQERRYDSAEVFFRRAVAADPERVEYRDHLAYALIVRGRPQEAETVLLEAIRLDRNYDLLYTHLADARLARGDTTGAVQALERFLAISLDQNLREAANRRIQELRAPQPVIPPPPVIQVPDDVQPQEPGDTVNLTPPPAREAPRDSIRLGPPER